MRTVLFFSLSTILLCSLPVPVTSGLGLLVIQYLKVDVGEATTVIRIGASAPLCGTSFMLTNPDRLVIECSSAVATLPPVLPDEAAKGFVQSVPPTRRDQKEATPAVRLVIPRSERCCYAIEPRLGGAVVPLMPCGPSWRLGYDEDRLVRSRNANSSPFT